MIRPRTAAMAAATAAAAFALALVASCRTAPPHAARPGPLAGSRPNIVFIFSDDHAPHAIGAYGSRINRTPNIDRLATDGLVFDRCYCGNSICGPSRAAILTGKHAHANGFMRNGNDFDGRQPTFPKLLRRAGYETAMIGKWHLTSAPTGFDHWEVLPGQGSYYNPDFRTPAGRHRREGYCTDLITELTLDWLRSGRDRTRPFLLMCQHKAPHRSWMPGPEELGLYRDAPIPEPATLFDDYAGRGPAVPLHEMGIRDHLTMFYDLKLVPDAGERQRLEGADTVWKKRLDRMTPEQRAAWDRAFEAENTAFRQTNPTGDALVRWKYQRYVKNYLRCVAGVDKSVGRILDHIDADPVLRENTIVIYCSDQGFYLGDHGWFDKRWMYEESMRMPLLVRWPDRIRSGTRTSALVQNIDFAATFLDLAGAPIPDDLHGTSLVPVLANPASATVRDALYYHYYESHATHNVAAHYGVHDGRYKLIRFYEPEHDYWELYDLERDPDELRSVWADPEYASIRAKLEQRLTALRERYDDRTGVLGDGAFDVIAGVATATRDDDGWRIDGNAPMGYALRPLDEPLPDRATLRTTVTVESTRGPRSIALLVASDDAARVPLRFEVRVARRSLAIRHASRDPIAERPAAGLDPARIELAATIDRTAGRLTLSAGRETLQVDLPAGFGAITRIGYGTDNTTARFGPIRVARE